MAYEGFAKLKGELAGKKGITNPGGLAASIGRKKYGKGKFQKAASSGTKMKGMHPDDAPSVAEYAAKRNKKRRAAAGY
jgi:hypothetical protein